MEPSTTLATLSGWKKSFRSNATILYTLSLPTVYSVGPQYLKGVGVDYWTFIKSANIKLDIINIPRARVAEGGGPWEQR